MKDRWNVIKIWIIFELAYDKGISLRNCRGDVNNCECVALWSFNMTCLIHGPESNGVCPCTADSKGTTVFLLKTSIHLVIS